MSETRTFFISYLANFSRFSNFGKSKPDSLLSAISILLVLPSGDRIYQVDLTFSSSSTALDTASLSLTIFLESSLSGWPLQLIVNALYQPNGALVTEKAFSAMLRSVSLL